MSEAATAAAARRATLLEAPITPTLARLAAPNLLQVGAQTAVSVAETYFIGQLGTAALAGVALVFPLIMLMQMTSAGAMGGGISSAVARALGGRQTERAAALAWHALLIAIVMGGLFTVAALAGGRILYASLGARGDVLTYALAYSDLIFAGAILFWLMNSLSSVMRGAGDMRTPAMVNVIGAVFTIAISPALIFGVGRFEGFGMRGAAAALLLFYAAGSLYLLVQLLRGRVGIRLVRHPFAWPLALDILKVGAVACLHAMLINSAVLIATSFVAVHGDAALAGYGIGARLEYLQIPIAFGFGAALVAMVGTNVGAGQLPRARRIAWIGGLVCGAIAGTIGLVTALAPDLWAGLYTTEPAVLEPARRYLRIVGPAYAFLGFGMGVYFAFQGTGRMVWPIGCVTVRIALIAIGCAVAARLFVGSLDALFAVMALALVVFGLLYAVCVRYRFAPGD